MYTDISCWSPVKSIMYDRWQLVTVLQRIASTQQIGLLLVPAIKGAVYINTHCNYSQPVLTKLYNENIGGHHTFTTTLVESGGAAWLQAGSPCLQVSARCSTAVPRRRTLPASRHRSSMSCRWPSFSGRRPSYLKQCSAVHHVSTALSLAIFRSRLKTPLFRRCFPWLHRSLVVLEKWDVITDTLIVFVTYLLNAAWAATKCLCVRHIRTFCQNELTHLRIFWLSGSQAILVFPYRTGWRYSDGKPPNGGVECRWVGRNRDSAAYIWLHCLLLRLQQTMCCQQGRRWTTATVLPQVVTHRW